MKTILGVILLSMTALISEAKEVTYITPEHICKKPYADQAILRRDPLFIDDFLTLHSLLKMTRPQTVFEIGTCTGEGTLIIKNAVGSATVYSLELPLGESSYDIKTIGEMCDLPYVQILGNSQSINYSEFYPIDAWFIDGAHDYTHVFYETKQALLSEPVIIIWHDADIPEVFEAIKDGLDNSNYLLFRVNQTRIAFSVPASSNVPVLIND